jgi:hypothetical protein
VVTGVNLLWALGSLLACHNFVARCATITRKPSLRRCPQATTLLVCIALNLGRMGHLLWL